MAARRQPTPTEQQRPRLEIRHLPTGSLSHYQNNPRRNDPAVDRLIPLLREFGLRSPLLVRQIDGQTEVVDGHLRLKAATKMGLAEVPTVDVSDLSEAQVRALRLAMNKSAEFAEWDDELLAAELRAIEALGMGLDLTGFGDEELARLLGQDEESEPSNAGALAAAFGVPPFTVLNAREGWWQDRKRAWLSLGIKSELGRGEGATWGDSAEITSKGLNHYRDKTRLAPGGGGAWLGGPKTASTGNFSKTPAGLLRGEMPNYDGANRDEATGTSIFDPVLCEIAYRWFSPVGGLILDPFAGGSVRGIVASKLGRQYIGH